MEVSGSQFVAAPQERVWAGLNDVSVLKEAVPGCERIGWAAPDVVELEIVLRIGPIAPRFTGRLVLSEIEPPNGYTLTGQGAGPMGSAEGVCRLSLEADGGATILHYTLSADAGGRLGKFGGKVLGATARHLADRFFKRLGEIAASSGGHPGAAQRNPGSQAD